MKNVDAMMSSRRRDWETPPELFDALDDEFGFTLDAAATYDNAKCIRYLTDALDVRWRGHGGAIWCNPPCSVGLGAWVRKGLAESQQGETVVMLIPSRTDTRWFHDCILDRAEVRFLRGRIRFVGAPFTAPFPSMVVIWRPA